MLLIHNMPSRLLHHFRAYPVVATDPLAETLNECIKQTFTQEEWDSLTLQIGQWSVELHV